jgi:TonB-linked SusC/RagA family outer membrane protein
VFGELKRQLGYDIIYAPRILEDAPVIGLDLHNADVREVLQSTFSGLQLGYHIDNHCITIFRKVLPNASLYVPLEGQVLGSDGHPLEGASIAVDGVAVTTTKSDGRFRIKVKSLTTAVTVSFLGYFSRTMTLTNAFLHVISLQSSSYTLDNVVVQAYGKTTSRLLNGSVSQVKGSDVNSQPVSNVLAALEGRVPGLQIRQYNGVPGSAYGILIRGQHSIAQGTDPLIIIDGMPIAGNNGSLSTIGSGSAQGAMGAASLNSILPSSIASIEVLKDASATAIYGSRGANGVILLTLKQGQPGRLKWCADVYGGSTHAVKTSPLLTTAQYRAQREEAVPNDGLAVDATTAPELFAWDSTRYTNFKNMIMGHNGVVKNARVDLSGGDTNTVFLVSGSYHGEGAVFPGSTGQDQRSLYGHLSHQPPSRRFRLDLSGIYSWGNTNLPTQDLTFFELLAPNTPPFRNAAGQLQWSYNGISYTNIEALSLNQYKASLTNQFNHLQVNYEVLPGLSLKGSLGYNRIQSDENSRLPLAGQDPAIQPTGHRYYTGNVYHSELVDGFAEYVRQLGPGKLEALLGVTWQQQRSANSTLNEDGFTSDLQLSTGSGAVTTTTAENTVSYRYEAEFGRLNYTLFNRYLFTLSGRRDGSSRFGPGNQYGNFWSVSSAWIFSDEPAVRRLDWLSWGKIRGSIGTTGNDQIGDNQFAQVYANTRSARGYQGMQGVYPVTFANDKLAWEVNYNSEIALDLGFLNNRIMLTAAAYRNWTANQLVYTSLPSQAGLPGVFSNLPASVVNKGLEFRLQTHNWVSRSFRWVSTLLLTAPFNQLKKFPNLAASIYADQLFVGKSLSEIKAYHYLGVDPATGVFTFRDYNKNGVLDPKDRIAGGNSDLHYYGGVEQNFQYKCWQLDLFFEFRTGKGLNPMAMLYPLVPPGIAGPSMLSNGSIEWQDHWRKAGDQARYQRLTTDPSSAAWQQLYNYPASDARLVDAGFIRWKSMALLWRLPEKWLAKAGLHSGQLYLQGQNLWTHSRFPVTDPETQDPMVLPPVRTLTAGCQITL